MSREDMQEALKNKIHSLFNKIENNKKLEAELKIKIIECHEKRMREEQNVMEMHDKLQGLEKLLHEKEAENDRLKLKLRDSENETEHVQTYWENEENVTEDEKEKSKSLREEYGDFLIATKNVKTKAEEVTIDILKLEKQLAVEEQFQENEEIRLIKLSNEMQQLNGKLKTIVTKEEEVSANTTIQKDKLSQLKDRHLDSDRKAMELDLECSRLESLLDKLTDQLTSMNIEEANVDSALNKESTRSELSESKRMVSGKTELHKAQQLKCSRKK